MTAGRMLAVTKLWFNRGSFWELVELNPRFRYRKISKIIKKKTKKKDGKGDSSGLTN